MKKIVTFCLIVTAAILFVSTSAMALPGIYEGTDLYDSIWQYGNQEANAGGRYGEFDLWGFYAEAGDVIDIVGTNHSDLVLSFYQGTTESKDGFNRFGSFGGMTYISASDDEGRNNGYGTWDPYLNFTVETTGYYTVAMTGYSTSGNDRSYDIMVTGNTVAPEPVSSVLFVVGGTVLGFRKRFLKKKAVLAV